MRRAYTALLYLFAPLIFLYLFLNTRRTQDYKQRWSELLGHISHSIRPNGIWLHAVSLGETMVAIPLTKAILKQYPNETITITTMTKSAAQRLQTEFGDSLQHIYVPLDFPRGIKRFLDVVQPRLAIFMETELWPNRFAICSERKIPIVIANARLSPQKIPSYLRIRKLISPMLLSVNRLIAQSEGDAERYQLLGMPASRITVAGNIKFDINVSDELQQKAEELRANWKTRPVWIAASTHEGEETQILQAFKIIRKNIPNLLLLLVPRHPARFNSVKTYCMEQGFNVSLRTVGETDYSNTDIFLGNTTGELMMFYAAADIAFVGGSFVPIGGHNLLEPASLGLPIIVGPHNFNSQEIYDLLTTANAVKTVNDADQLAADVTRIFNDRDLSQRMGQSGKQVVSVNQGSTARHLEVVSRLL